MKTMDEVARDLGISKTTVSLVLNGKAQEKRISEKTMTRVHEYCRKNNFQPNIHASLTRRRVVRNILVLANPRNIPGDANFLSDNNMAGLLGGIAEETEAHDYTFMVRVYSSKMNDDEIFNSFRRREIDGMIYYGNVIPEAWRQVFMDEKRNVVGVSVEPGPGIAAVNIDNRNISRKLALFLLERGAKRFLYIAGTKGSYPSDERLAGFIEGLAGQGLVLSDECVLHGEYEKKLAAEQFRQYLKSASELPDAVVCANDMMAIGVLEAAREAGVKIPETMMLAGGDNIEISSYVKPRLTTFDYRAADLGKTAFRLLFQMINGKALRNVMLPSFLVAGESVR